MDLSSMSQKQSDVEAEIIERIDNIQSIQEINQIFFAAIKDGLDSFKKYDSESKLAEVIQKIEAYSPSKHFFTSHYFSIEDFEKLMEVANLLFFQEEYTIAKPMFEAIAYLFPLNAQPLIMLAEIDGQQQGLYAAVSAYEKLVKVLKNPLLFVHAAECFLHADKKSEARELLLDALWLCSHSPNQFSPLVKEIEDLIKETE